jgi:hypothetical protein
MLTLSLSLSASPAQPASLSSLLSSESRSISRLNNSGISSSSESSFEFEEWSEFRPGWPPMRVGMLSSVSEVAVGADGSAPPLTAVLEVPVGDEACKNNSGKLSLSLSSESYGPPLFLAAASLTRLIIDGKSALGASSASCRETVFDSKPRNQARSDRDLWG